MVALLIVAPRGSNQDGEAQPRIQERFPNYPLPVMPLDSNNWAIANSSESHSTRVYKKATYGGFRTRGLGREPSTKRLTLAYFPSRIPGNIPWYAPLDVLKFMQGLEVELFYYTLSIGAWILEKVEISEENWLGAQPVKVMVSLNFVELDRDWTGW